MAVLVDSKSKKVMQIRNIPEKLSKEEAIRHFGTDYVISKYEFCPDIDATTAPVYPDPNGPLVRIEYRKRGIVLDLDDDKTIGEIAYVKDIQVLASKEDCKKIQKKR